MTEREQTRTVYVFPVPGGMEPDDAFEEIETFGQLVGFRWWKPRFRWPFRKWAVVSVEDP